MWRVAGEPFVIPGVTDPYDDVPAKAYYHNAVNWAWWEGITKGTADRIFSPNDTCTRGQIVTFLYRDLFIER